MSSVNVAFLFAKLSNKYKSSRFTHEWTLLNISKCWILGHFIRMKVVFVISSNNNFDWGHFEKFSERPSIFNDRNSWILLAMIEGRNSNDIEFRWVRRIQLNESIYWYEWHRFGRNAIWIRQTILHPSLSWSSDQTRSMLRRSLSD